MRLPQVSERIKEAPAQALRGVFAGIGQLLLITDKLRNKTPAHPEAPHAAVPPQAAEPEPLAAEPPQASAPEPSPAPSPTPEPAATEASAVQRDSDKTGNVRLLTEEAGRADVAAAKADVPAAKAGVAAAKAGVPAAKAGVPAAKVGVPAGAGQLPAEQVSTGTAQAVAPLPNYDELTIASLRARLRNLSVEQVRELAEYERAHAARPEVITMFERRVAKLEAGA